jgi:hypothetical protein
MSQLLENFADFIFRQDIAPLHFHLAVRKLLINPLAQIWMQRGTERDIP